MKVLFLSSEVAPFSKTGGLADVLGALPRALSNVGHDVRVATPLYPSVSRDGLEGEGESLTLEFPFGSVSSRIHTRRESSKLHISFIEQPAFFDRPEIYGDRNGDYQDNPRRFGFFTMAALTAAQRAKFIPDIVHLNDWPTGLGALALRRAYRSIFPKARSVMTIHNLGYQGNFAKREMDPLGIPWELFTVNGVEFWDHLSFLKTGLTFADALTTVSPTYAKEIHTAAHGFGLDGVIRARTKSLHGILNGVDTSEWNPATDVLLPARFSSVDLSGRDVCRKALLERAGLQNPAPGMPLFGVIGRMVEQKGGDLMLAALPQLLEHGACAVVLGSGAAGYENAWKSLQGRYSGRLSVSVGFDNALAHLIEAGSDFFLMPSRYEPCGLNQMYSQLYGALPVVHAVGGLRDTVTDVGHVDGTGIVFENATVDAFRGALNRAIEVFRDRPRFDRARAKGMAKDFSWAAAARQYASLYESLPQVAGEVR